MAERTRVAVAAVLGLLGLIGVGACKGEGGHEIDRAPPAPPVTPADAAPPSTPSALPPARYDGPAIDASAWTPHVLPRPAKLAATAALGDALDLDGDTLVVGAPGAAFTETPGAVYVYQRKNGAWGAPVELPAPTARDQFGHAVAVSGDTIAAAARGGLVHIYRRRGARWVAAETVGVPAEYHVAIDLDRDTLIVGIADHNRAHVYTRYDDTFTHGTPTVIEAPALPADPTPELGWKVALRGDHLAVAARQAKCRSGIEMCGAVVLATRDHGLWKPEVTLPTGDLTRWTTLGFALGIDEHAVVMGADGEQRAWVIERAADGWRDAGALGERPRDGATGDPHVNYALAVAVRGPIAARAVVAQPSLGAPPTVPGTNEIDTAAMGRLRGAASGQVLVYARARDGWTQAASLTSPDASAGDGFGSSLAIGDDVIVAGAPAAGAGEVVVFDRAAR